MARASYQFTSTDSMECIYVNGIPTAPFKLHDSVYGAFANTTPHGTYPIQQTQAIDGKSINNIMGGRMNNINWPSAEHAFHGQKLIQFIIDNINDPTKISEINTVRNIIQNIINIPCPFLPRDPRNPGNQNTYEGIITTEINNGNLNYANKTAFDAACKADYHPIHNISGITDPKTGYPYTYKYMKFVVKMKLNQHQDLASTAIEFARRGIMPVEVSQHDVTWASGKDGNGSNYLGIIIAELGRDLLLNREGVNAAVQNPHQAYTQLKGNPLIGHNDPNFLSFAAGQENACRNITRLAGNTVAGHVAVASTTMPAGVTYGDTASSSSSSSSSSASSTTARVIASYDSATSTPASTPIANITAYLTKVGGTKIELTNDSMIHITFDFGKISKNIEDFSKIHDGPSFAQSIMQELRTLAAPTDQGIIDNHITFFGSLISSPSSSTTNGAPAMIFTSTNSSSSTRVIASYDSATSTPASTPITNITAYLTKVGASKIELDDQGNCNLTFKNGTTESMTINDILNIPDFANEFSQALPESRQFATTQDQSIINRLIAPSAQASISSPKL